MEDDFISIKESLNDTFIRLKELENSKNGITGISTGFCDLDYAIKGLNKSNLIVIASRPTMGKTSLTFNIATHVAVNEKIPVLIFSLELSKELCTNRILSSQALVENSKLNTGKLDDEEWKKVIKTSEQLSNAEIYINDTPGLSVNKIREKCIKLKQDKDIGLVVIDYLQLIERSNKRNCNPEQEISEISLELKKLAQEINVPIIILYQLPTRVQRSDKRPILSELQSSITENSDVVMFLYRDDYYNPYSERKNIAEVIIAKNRYGTSNNITVELLFMERYLKFGTIKRCYDDNSVFNDFDRLSEENELNGDYKHIHFGLKMILRINKFTKNTNLNCNDFIEEYQTELEKAKQNNWLHTYKILSILVEKLNIKYTLLQVKDEIFENTSLSFVWLVLNDEGDISNNIHFRFETKSEYKNRIKSGILKYDKAIIEVDKKYQKEVESTLDSICSNWKEQICIRYIED